MPETPPLGDWATDEFEANAGAVVELISDYFDGIRDRRVTTAIEPGALLELLDGPLPEHGEPFERIVEETRAKVLPHLTHWNHPRFHAYFSISASFAGILADMLVSAVDVNAMVWRSAPAASTLETVVMRWIAEMVGYDAGADGVLVNGASLGTFYALCAARDAVPGIDVRRRGLTAPGTPMLRVYASDQAHSSVDKAVIALGVGLDNLVVVPSDERYRMRADALEELVRRDVDAGLVPMAVVATVGTTSTGAADPLDDVARVCRRHGAWLHVDAAYGGFWNLVPEIRAVAEDLGIADSVVVNPHKCLYTPLEVTCLYSARRGALADTFRLVPEYLRTDAGEGALDYMDFTLQLGRSFRALKLWWVIRTFGRAGLVARLRESVRIAGALRAAVDGHPDFECVGESAYPLVCLRLFPRRLRAEVEGATETRRAEIRAEVDELNARLLRRFNDEGRAFVSHAVVREGYVVRVSIGNIRTTEDDVMESWDALRRIGERVAAPIEAR
ncbi:MAG TPA: pyridoxal-dependent decarboxylase [Actinomycetota bacterium]|nr:pyridoxal-dependent decarboxylase [Actinomycetota bacterium]